METYPVRKTINDVKSKALVHTQVDTLSQEQARRVSDTLIDVKATKLVQALHDTLANDDGKNYW